MVRVFAHQHMGDERLCWQAALDQTGRRRGLADPVSAGTAGIFRADGLDDPVLGGNDVDAGAAVFADLVHQPGVVAELSP